MLAQALCAFVVAFAAPAFVVGELPDRQPVVAELVHELVACTQRGNSPAKARPLVAELHSRFAASGPKDQRAIASGIEAFLLAQEPVEPFGREISREAVQALASMGDEGVVALLGLIGEERCEGDLELQRHLILGLGRTRSDEGIPRLVKLLRHSEPVVQGAAAEALGEFAKLEGERRKDVFCALLQTLLDALGETERHPFDVVVRQRYDTIVAPITTSLQRLSGHDERDPILWQRYWNKHKRDDWDASML